MKEFTKEFYRLAIISGQTSEGEYAVSRYVNGLKCAIQDEVVKVHENWISLPYFFEGRGETV